MSVVSVVICSVAQSACSRLHGTEDIQRDGGSKGGEALLDELGGKSRRDAQTTKKAGDPFGVGERRGPRLAEKINIQGAGLQ